MQNESTGGKKSFYQFVILGFLLLAAWSVQSQPGTFLQLMGVRPVLLLPLTVCVGVCYGELTGGLFGMIAGLLMDVYVTPSVAFNTVALSLIGVACALAIRHVLIDRFWSVVLLCGLGALVYFTLYWLVIKAMSGGGNWDYFMHFSLPATVYTALVGLPVYPLIRWICRRL